MKPILKLSPVVIDSFSVCILVVPSGYTRLVFALNYIQDTAYTTIDIPHAVWNIYDTTSAQADNFTVLSDQSGNANNTTEFHYKL